MLYKNRHELFLGAIYLAWLVLLIFTNPTSLQCLLTSLLLTYFLAQKLNAIRTVMAGLLMVLASCVGMLLHVEEIFVGTVPDPSLYIFTFLLLITIYYAVRVWGATTASSLPATEKHNDANERQKLFALVNSMADGVIATDQYQKVTIYNGAALDVLNVNVSLESRDITEFLKLTDATGQPVDIFERARKARTSYVTRDLVMEYSDNDKINLYLSIAPVSVGYGQKSTLGYIILLRDITKEKSLEEERDEFISVVSHELRTPIAVTEGAISNAQFVAGKNNADKAVTDSLNEAHRNAVFLADMINDLAMLSRAERGKLQVDPESIDIVKMLENIQSDYSMQAKQKGLELVVAKMPHIKPVNSAPLYVKEILQNFVTNSIKYTEKGTVTISAKHTDRGADVMVTDTGIGISKSDQKKLFEKFFRSEDFRTRQNSGTGLGLYVTMKLAHLIGATIDVESKLNVGSTFTISIPNLEAHHHRKRSQ